MILRHSLIIGFFIGTMASVQAVTITSWNFETNTPSDANNTTTQSTAADIGIGTGTGLHASDGTDYSTPAGNGSANSWSANNWATGDYWQFQFGTVGFQSIMVDWDQTRSGTGPGVFDFSYSINGSDFTLVSDDYSVDEVSWSSSGSPKAASHFSLDLSSEAAVDDVVSVFLRLTAQEAGSSTAGSNRVDNFTVSGSPIASVPVGGATLPMLGGAALAVLAAARRNRFCRIPS